MARKRLIKGANAARVEERIARVPADMARLEAPSIFGALRAMEEGPAAPKPAAPKPAAPKPATMGGAATAGARLVRKPAAPKPAAPKARPARGGTPTSSRTEQRKPIPQPQAEAEPDRTAAPAATSDEGRPPKLGRLSPSDFNAAEREAIVRCCSDYRNHLPTYLLAVQKELRVLDSVIEKCQASGGRSSGSRSSGSRSKKP